MGFSSLTMLYYFILPVVLGYALIWKVWKKNYDNTLLPNLYLCLVSLIFYWWGAGIENVMVILFLVIIHYALSYLLRLRKSKLAVVLGIGLDCFVLVKYKYPELILQAINGYMTNCATLVDVVFPLGLSFIIFHGISFLVDVYRQPSKGENEGFYFIQTALYLMFFPKITQGPIMRYCDMEPELENRTFDFNGLMAGTERFILGLGKKAILADTFGAAVSQIFSATAMDAPTAWLGVLLFSLQLYLDFSGYSDMAIGLARIFGFHFQNNFNFPYFSKSISEFWRRWHISLGAWFRTYIYIPLGGSREGSVYFNLLMVFLLTGMWHGNTGVYILWGLFHGMFVLFERTSAYQNLKNKIPGFSVIGWIYTTLAVGIGWLCFRVTSLGELWLYIKRLFGVESGDLVFTWHYYLTPKLLFFIVITCVGMAILSRPAIREIILKTTQMRCWAAALKYIALVGLFLLCFLHIVNNGYSPFLYFNY